MTIYDIAEEAGVSASTVSRVINNKESVSEKTREKVKAILNKHDYFPDETARGLVNKSTKIIGILVDDITTVHHAEGAHIIEEELSEYGYCCLILNTGKDNTSKVKYIETLKRRRVDGAVLMGSIFQNEIIKKAIKKHLGEIPVVIVNGYLELPNVYGVLADEKEGISSCVELLANKGHDHPAFVIDNYTPSNKLKQLGFEQAIRKNNLSKNFLVYETESSLDGAYNITKKIIEEHPKVNGIIYAIDLLAASGIRALLDMGISIPDEVSVIGVDNSIYAEISNPKLTSLDNKILDLSKSAARTLIDVLKGSDVIKKILIFSTIVERETT